MNFINQAIRRAIVVDSSSQDLNQLPEYISFYNLDGTPLVIAYLVNGKIPFENLPSIVINDTFVVSSQAAMLASNATKGDIAVRSDIQRNFILSTDSPSTLVDWIELEQVPDAVISVAGRTGAVVLSDLYDALGAAATAQSLSQPLDSDLTAICGLSPTNNDIIQRIAGSWVNRTMAQLKTALTLLKGDVGLGNVDNIADTAKPISTAQQTALNGKADLVGGFVPSAQLPSYVDDVLEYANLAALPGTGVAGIIYVTLDENKTYRWSGSAYTEISASLALGETSGTAYRGDRGKVAYDHSQLVAGNPHNVTKADVGLSNVSNTSDANKPVSTAQQTALDLKANFLVPTSGNVNTGTAQTIPAPTAPASVFKYTLTGNCTFTLPTAVDGSSFIARVFTGAGSFTATFTGAKWPIAGAPTVTATASKMDEFAFASDGTNWYGHVCNQGYTP